MTSSGVLKMTSSAGVLTVSGNVTFQGSNETGLLTAGTLNIGGNFTESSGCCADNFAASGTHTVVFNGTAAQTVSFRSEEHTSEHQSPEHNACRRVRETTEAQAHGTLAVT